MLLVGPVAAAADGGPSNLYGDLSVERATLEGVSTARFGPGSLFAPPTKTESAPLRLEVEAKSAAVRWTRIDYASVGNSAGSPDESLLLVAKGGATTGGRDYEDVRLDAITWHPDANWMILPSSPNATIRYAGDGLVLEPAANVTWRAGYPGSLEAQVLPGPTLRQEHTLPDGLPLLHTSHAQDLTVEGDFQLYLWGLNATVTDAGGRDDAYPSGLWSGNRTGTQADPRGVSRDDHAQFVSIKMAGARLRLMEGSSPLWTSSSTLEASGPVTARLEGATGRLGGGMAPVTVSKQVVDLEGQLEFRVREGSDAGQLLVQAAGTVSSARVDGVEWPVAVQAAATRSALPTRIGASLLLLAVLGFLGWAIVAWRRRRPTLLEVAEADVLGRRSPRARRRLRRWLSRRPNDAEAWFLYGAAWLQEGAPEPVVGEIEPVARRLGPSYAPSLAFLLAIAHARLRHAEPALEWLRAALGEPVFRERAAREPDFAFLRQDTRFRRLVEAEAPAYG
jgi:hypothetical protein